jgi:hypothetical protein
MCSKVKSDDFQHTIGERLNMRTQKDTLLLQLNKHSVFICHVACLEQQELSWFITNNNTTQNAYATFKLLPKNVIFYFFLK